MRSFLRTVLGLATVIGVCVWLAGGASAASPDSTPSGEAAAR